MWSDLTWALAVLGVTIPSAIALEYYGYRRKKREEEEWQAESMTRSSVTGESSNGPPG